MPWIPAADEIEDILNRRTSKARPPNIFSFGGAVVTCKALGCPQPDAMHVGHVGIPKRLDFSGFGFIGRRGPVSLAQRARVSQQAGHPLSHRTLGGWMDYSFFLVETTNAGRPSEFTYRTCSMGHAENTNPKVPVSGTATWTGIMSGVVTSRSRDAGSFVNGDAILTVTDLDPASDLSVDVEFSNIVHEDTGAEVGRMAWKGLTLNDGGFGTGHVLHDRGDGFFGDGGRGISWGEGIRGSWGEGIYGQFYGPNHEEVGGLFNRDDIAGVFAARREAGGPMAPSSSPPPE